MRDTVCSDSSEGRPQEGSRRPEVDPVCLAHPEGRKSRPGGGSCKCEGPEAGSGLAGSPTGMDEVFSFRKELTVP